jgi:hypothetical protein
MKMSYKWSIAALLVLSVSVSQAEALREGGKKKKVSATSLAAGCAPASSATELDINNTRALIQTGGDMWWDFRNANYEIPQGSGQTSLFAGSLWLGGKDVSGQLKVAAHRFRQAGVDFWAGPLSTTNSEIDAATCAEYDEHYVTTRSEVAEFVGWFEAGLEDAANGTNKQREQFPNYELPRSIIDWPAHGRNYEPYNEDFYLAPFIDRNGDGVYNPFDGDYPGYDLKGEVDCRERIVNIYGDQNLWWVFNDKGNVHTETGAQAIGMEIRAQAFAFATNDEVNNMTFYNYELVNRSTFTLTDTYFGVWVDADLGCSQDDYVGCDVQRGLGYCYNGDENDEDCNGATGYGNLPPAIGVDFFQGPFQDNDGLDNIGPSTNSEVVPYDLAKSDKGIPYKGLGVGYGDGVVDNERFGMSRFLYHNNDQSVRGDPNSGVEYYNYLRSLWRDGSHMVYGGTGHVAGAPSTLEADFMFPGNTDLIGWGTGGQVQEDWTEVTAGNQPFDRRFMQSAGPFTLEPGAVNNITFGVVWARAKSGNAEESVQAVRKADDKTQALFDNCFRVLNGPDAPDLTVQELDRELVLYLDNKSISNNYREQYAEVDPSIIPPDSINGQPITPEQQFEYQAYRFQGYQIYQVKDNTVSASDLGDIDKARLVAQCDIIDSVEQIVNFTFDDEIGATVPEIKVNGGNEGIRRSFRILTDQFAEGDNRLVNHKSYYFIAVAYSYNNYVPFNPLSDDSQNEPYLASRKGATGPIRSVQGIPHDTRIENSGTILNAQYGDGVEIIRIEGTGNGGNVVDFQQETVDAILAAEGGKVDSLKYRQGFGPVNIRVIDPLNVASGKFSLAFRDTVTNGDLTDAYWQIFGEGIDTFTVASSIEVETEHLIPELGISVTIGQALSPGRVNSVDNGFLFVTAEYEDPTQPFMLSVPDGETQGATNWILSGTQADDAAPEWDDYKVEWQDPVTGRDLVYYFDEDEVYENLLEGSIAPFFLTAEGTGHGPKPELPGHGFIYRILGNEHPGDTSVLNLLHSVDLVMTPDKDKWTRVPVLEMRDTVGEAQGGAEKGRLRAMWSVDMDGNYASDSSSSTDPNSPNFISGYGMSWFPGYAINTETGERLNMAFGEDSYFLKENGRDMIFNPTSTVAEGPAQDFRGGGKHYVIIFRNNDVEDERNSFPLEYNNPENRMPAYDHGQFIFDKLSQNTSNSVRDVYRAASWCLFPLKNPLIDWRSMADGLVPTTLTVKVRVAKEYESRGNGEYISEGQPLTIGEEYFVNYGPIVHDTVTYTRGQSFVAWTNSFSAPSTDKQDVLMTSVNGGRPLYNFDLTDLAPTKNVSDLFEDLLEEINVVPNPYYSYSQYESDKIDTRVRITNLPQRCSIKIYNVNGTLVRTFEKDDPTISSLDWDLKNQSRTPVASGVYLIHVDVPNVGSKVLKWFGILRPIDLDNF